MFYSYAAAYNNNNNNNNNKHIFILLVSKVRHLTRRIEDNFFSLEFI